MSYETPDTVAASRYEALLQCFLDIEQNYGRMYRLWYAGAFFMALLPWIRPSVTGESLWAYEGLLCVMVGIVVWHTRQKKQALQTLTEVIYHHPETIIKIELRPWVYKDCLFILRDGTRLSVYAHVFKLNEIKHHLSLAFPHLMSS
ncbi:MAG: hypothetical protein ACKO37_08930 [Vampirovibrionales bacterium]